jgi:predicted dehydrogenase
MARAGDVDVAVVCTPPFLHRAQVEDLLRAGAHVVCEKPLVGSLREVDELATVEQDTGRRLMPVFQYRFGHGLQRLRALVDEDRCGRALATSVDVAWQRGADYYAAPWRGRWGTELGGVLLTHCVHALDMATYVLGDVGRAFARTTTRVNDVETDDGAAVALELAEGSTLTLSATLGSAREITRHRFCFERLTAESNDAPYTSSSDPWSFVAADPGAQAELDEAVERIGAALPEAEGFQRQYELLHAALGGGGELPVTLADARRSLELVSALYWSARTHADVELPLGREHPVYDGWRG